MKKRLSAVLVILSMFMSMTFSVNAAEYYNIAFADSRSAAVTVKGCLGKDAANQSIEIQLRKPNGEIISGTAQTDYRGCYSTEFEFSGDINKSDVEVIYNGKNAKAEIKTNEYGNLNVKAYKTPEGIVCVEGYTEAKYAGNSINVLLADKSYEDGLFDFGKLAHIGSCTADKTGHFLYKFTFDGDISSQNLLVKIKGGNWTNVAVRDEAEERSIISLGLTNEKGERAVLGETERISLNALVDSRRSRGTNADLLAAYYDENGSLIGVDAKFKFNFKFSDSGVIYPGDFLPEIPAEAKNVKLMVWEDGSLTPIGATEEYPAKITKKYFYVSPDGNDLNDGSLDKPLATLEGAKNAVRQYKDAKGLPENGITVLFKGGTYHINNTIEFTAADSGTEERPITYAVYNGEDVVFDGSIHISGSEFKKADGTELLNRIPQASRSEVYCIDLKDYGIYSFGNICEKNHRDSKDDVPGCEVFYDDKPMLTARYPNAASDGKQVYLITGDASGEESTEFGYTDETLENAVSFDDATVEGWMTNGYDYKSTKIDSIDTGNNILKVKQSDEYRKNGRYFINNIPEALDTENEYYLDRGTGILYMIPEGDITNADIAVSVFGENVSESVIRTNRAFYIVFNGFTITNCRSGGIYVYGGSNIGIDNCTVKNMGYTGIIVGAEERGGASKTINGYNCNNAAEFYNSDYEKAYRHSITDCTIYNTGEGAVVLYGGDRIGLKPSSFTLSGCILHDCGRSVKSAPIVVACGDGITINNNDIYNAASAGISFAGNDIIIEKNDFHHLVDEAEDFGMLYSCTYGAEIQAGTEIRYNYFHDVSGEIKNVETAPDVHIHKPAVYNDFCDPFLEVHNNLFEDVPIGIWNGGGAENNWTDNVFVNADIPMLVQWNHLLWDNIEQGNKLENMFNGLSTREYHMISVDSGIWKEKYPKVSEVKARLEELGEEAVYPNSDIRNNVAFFLNDEAKASLEKLSLTPSESDSVSELRQKYLDKITMLQHYTNLEQNKFLKERGLDTNIYTDTETAVQNRASVIAEKGIDLSMIGAKKK